MATVGQGVVEGYRVCIRYAMRKGNESVGSGQYVVSRGCSCGSLQTFQRRGAVRRAAMTMCRADLRERLFQESGGG